MTSEIRIDSPDQEQFLRELLDAGLLIDSGRPRGVELMRGLGLDAQLENDPFFGRAGRLLAASQSAEELEWELVIPVAGPEPTACASFNYHLDRFGETWELNSPTVQRRIRPVSVSARSGSSRRCCVRTDSIPSAGPPKYASGSTPR